MTKNGENDDLHSTHKNKGQGAALLRARKPTKMTKMAGVPQTKPGFAKNRVFATLNFLRFPAMCPPPPPKSRIFLQENAFFCRKKRIFLQESTCFCRKMLFFFSAGKCIFLQEIAFFCTFLQGSRIMNGSLFLYDRKESKRKNFLPVQMSHNHHHFHCFLRWKMI